jgi:type IV pilus assembly protein PilN
MIEINLLPVREARRAADLRQQVMQLLLVLLVVGAGIGFVHSNLNRKIDTARARVVQMQRAAFRKKKAQLEKKIDIIDELDRARSGPVRMMSELATRTPERLWLTSVKTSGSTIMMKGSSLDNELVAVFLRGLGDSPLFRNVDLDGTRLENGGGDLKLVQFGVRAEIDTGKAEEKAPAPAQQG